MFMKITQDNIHDVAIQYKNAFSSSPWDVETSEERIREYAQHPLFRGYLKMVDGVIVSAVFGMLQQYYEGIRYNLTDLFTAPECQNRGYASELLDYIKVQLKRENVTQIVLISLNDDLHNHFYDTKNHFNTREELCVKRYFL